MSTIGARRWALLALPLVAALALAAGQPVFGQGKEFQINGSVDCGVRTGRLCSIGEVLGIRTDDVTGELTHVDVVIVWIKQHLTRVRQDDPICVVVRTEPDGRLWALAIPTVCDEAGTINPGASSGNQLVPEQPKRPNFDTENEPGPTPTSTPAPGATPTGATLPDLTVTIVEANDPIVITGVAFGPNEQGLTFALRPGIGAWSDVSFGLAPQAADEADFTFQVTNLGGTTGNNVRLAVEQTFTPALSSAPSLTVTTTGGLVCSPSSAASVVTLECAGANVPPGGVATVRLRYTPDPAESPTVIDTTAVVDPDGTIQESDEGNNQDTEQTDIVIQFD